MSVNVGDRFIKANVPYIVWEVSRISRETNPIPHAILNQEGRYNRQITLSVPALATVSMYTKLTQ